MLNRDFREFIELLDSNKVKYLVLGGYAVAFHGHPRYTKDLDIWLESSEDNALRVLRALEEFRLWRNGFNEGRFFTKSDKLFS